MTEPRFDFAGVFDEDYLYFYETLLPDELSDRNAALIGRLLDLEPGMDVLDLACGHGRIANRLAAAGCRVTGLDASELFLGKARADAAARGVRVEYVRGDMRRLPWPAGSFDRVVNWFTSFGYFSDDGNRQVLREMRRVLRDDGRAMVEVNARDRVLRFFQHTTSVERDGALMVDRHRWEPITDRIATERVIVREGRVRRTPFSVRMFTFSELRSWLLDAGFSSVAGFDQDGEPFGSDARRMAVVADVLSSS